MAVELAPELLRILACPNCHSALAVDHDADELVCTGPECGLAYPVRDGIPVLLIDEARRPQARVSTGPAAEGPGGDGPDSMDSTGSTDGPVGADEGAADPSDRPV